MIDIQSQPDGRRIAIDQVGVSGLRAPMTVLDRARGTQGTVGTFSLSASLPHDFKGTHMSRFVEILNRRRGEVTARTLPAILAEIRSSLEAESARLIVDFPYFVERAAPVSGARALLDCDCRFTGSSGAAGDDFILAVKVPVASLCPCSKAISDYGAHNQRGVVSLEVRSAPEASGGPAIVWIEELVEIAEAGGSSPVYPLLKREDERHVTMRMYENPVFVEDLLRNVAGRLMADARIAWFRLHVENHESIHNHNAFAECEWRRPAGESGAGAGRP